MTIYARTEEGQLAAYSPDSVLPRKLRSLLKVIDGKTPVDVYTTSLRAFGDVQGVLTSLDIAGLIRPMSQLPMGGAAGALQDAALDAAQDAALDAALEAAQGEVSKTWGRSNPSSGSFRDTTPFNSSATQGASTQAAFMPTRYGGNDPVGDFARTQALAHAVDTMSVFVLTNAPEHSFTVLNELEQLANLQQLAVILGGYEQLIAHLGAPAKEHILLINNILRDHL